LSDAPGDRRSVAVPQHLEVWELLFRIKDRDQCVNDGRIHDTVWVLHRDEDSILSTCSIFRQWQRHRQRSGVRSEERLAEHTKMKRRGSGS